LYRIVAYCRTLLFRGSQALGKIGCKGCRSIRN